MGRQDSKGTLEVHSHHYLSSTSSFEHSHEGGGVPHKHPDTGPATFVIDKDEWHAATGLDGGGRKKFTHKPTGPQLPIAELEDWQRTFRVVFVDEYTDGHAGAGISREAFEASRAKFEARGAASAHAAAGMVLSFGMTPTSEVSTTEPGRPWEAEVRASYEQTRVEHGQADPDDVPF